MFKKKFTKKMVRENIVAYTFLLPGLLLFLTVGLYSVIFSIRMSFYNWSGVDFSTARFEGLNNFKNILFGRNPQQTIDFRNAIFNNFKIAFFSIIVILPLALIIAVMIQRTKKGGGVLRTIYFIPMVASGAAIYYAWQGLYASDGVLNSFLSKIGLDFFVVRDGILGNPKTALIGVIIVVIWTSLPSTMILYYAGLSNISESIYEAANIDGASKFTVMWKITWPLLKPMTVVALINALNASFQMFDNIFILTGGGPAKSTDVSGTLLYTTAFRDSQYGNASAMGWTVFILTLILSLISLKRMKTDY
ncbi:sugar ABC transporter permease [Vallitalea longa]|uniref:Sugar ABC transporter permease n=1 Tax=Vallitalea longa TaxID=2936439 RepID=A0A9W6DDV5_9FIRM|nr:sugar ABC transporter permease [Vallitalea longa]GKX27692.1 sugar ABC transporter permease [Vallitalea longa]